MNIEEKKKLILDSILKNYICPLPAFALYSNYGFEDMRLSTKKGIELMKALDIADANKAELQLTEEEFTDILDALVEDGRLLKNGDNYMLPDAESYYPNQVTIDESSYVPLVYFANNYWHMLEMDFNTLTMTLMSKYPVAFKPYHVEDTEVTWMKSSLRDWLNNEYLNTFFNKEQQSRIIKKKFEDEEFSDKVWMLSPDEMEWVLDALGDSTVLDVPIWLRNNNGNDAFWMGSCTASSDKAPIAIGDFINYSGISITEAPIGVVPVIDVKVDAGKVQELKENILSAMKDKHIFIGLEEEC